MLKKEKISTKTMVRVALFSAIATVLYFVAEIPLIPGFEHLKLDLSTIPTVVAGFVLGIPAGLAVELIKNLLHLFKTSSLGIGELINFLIGATILISSKLTYNFVSNKFGGEKNKFSALLAAIIVAVVATIVIGMASNAVLFPLYMSIMGKPQLPPAAFVAYLISTITFNAIKPVITLIPSALLINPLQKVLK